jgi:23S rRNA (cytosine1962-C5)-methyltransferase
MSNFPAANGASSPNLPQTSSEPKGAGPRLRLRLTQAAETAVRRGHPWVYSDSVRSANRPGVTGELAAVYDRSDRLLALGWYDADSPIRVRILERGPAALDAEWWRARLAMAAGRRTLGPETTGFRVVHGENDGFPGLVADRYGDTVVAKLYFAAWLPRWTNVASLLQSELRPARLVLRLSRNLVTQAATFGLSDGEVTPSDAARDPARFLENGLVFEADVFQGQKTGFFLDQRENRARVGAMAAGADVLNLFSFSGGFSLYAARGGARSVTDVDISAHSLSAGRRNFALNQSVPSVAAAVHRVIQADVFEWLDQQHRERFDLVVVDPPSLARRESERATAAEAYARLAARSATLVRPGGRVVAASCNAHVSLEEFLRAVHRGVAVAGRRCVGESVVTEPPDHPAIFEEAKYLKAAHLQL